MKKRQGKMKSIFRWCITGVLAVTGFVAYSIPNTQASADEVDMGAKAVTSYFTATENVTLTPNVNTPDYIAEAKNSLYVESPTSGTVTYNTVIDVTEKTKQDLLLEWQPMPKMQGVPEMTQMIVRLEDAENPKYYVNISMRRYTFSGNTQDLSTHLLAQPNTVQDFYGWRYGKGMTTNLQWGTIIRAPWVGAKGGFSNGIKIYYDNEERAIYTGVLDNEPIKEYDTDGDGRLLVVDMDDPKHMGADTTKQWGGFPSNKIKVSFIANELVADTAGYMIYSIDGQKFDGKLLNDVTPPVMTVAQGNYADDALPQAEVGKYYPFLSASATDKIYGDIGVKVCVYKDGKQLYHTGAGFVPTQTGEYVLEYVAVDGNANETIKRFTVTAVENVSEICCTLSATEGALRLHDEGLKNENGYYAVDLYYPVKLPKMEVSGGSGAVEVETRVTINGAPVIMANGVFTPQEYGVYEVAYIARDYLGNQKTVYYYLETVIRDVPLLVTPVLPEAILVGSSVQFPKVNASYYTVWNQKISTYDVITVYKADGTTVIERFDGSQPAVYTPTDSEEAFIVVEYSSATAKGAETVTYRKEIRLQSAQKLVDRFVAEEGVEIAEKDIGFDLTFTAESSTVSYINALSVFDGLNIEFIVPAEANGYDEIEFTFIDSIDSSISMTVNIYKNPVDQATTSYITINDDRLAQSEMTASFYGNVAGNFLFVLAQNGEVSHSDLGLQKPSSDFVGFTSGYVYVTISVHGLETGEESKDAVLTLYRLKNQILGDIEDDFIKPILYVANEPIGIAKLGETIAIPQAFASDVYNIQVSLSVEVKFEGKVVYKAEDAFGKIDGAQILASDYGIYTIAYKAQDAAGNAVSRQYVVRVRDTVAPTLTVTGSVADKVKAGENLVLPKVTATDNVNASLTVYAVIIDPMNWYTVIDVSETYTLTMRGRYIVKFYCIDDGQNQAYSEDYYLIAE